MTMQLQSHIGCMIIRRSLGRQGKVFQELQERFLRDNGPEWTCKRSKTVWNIALLLRQGDVDGAKALCQSGSIAYHKSTGIPKGIEGYVVRQYLIAQRPSVLKRLAACMRFYTSLTNNTLSHSQKEKAVNSISGPYTGSIPEHELENLGLEMICDILADRDPNRKFATPKPFTIMERDASHLKETSSYHSEKIPPSLKMVPGTSFAASLISRPWIPTPLLEGIPSETTRSNLEDWYRKKYGDKQQEVGTITVLQEQGCKARVVTQPTAWNQLAFMPLNSRLFDVSEGLFPQESCCFDQSKGVYAMHMQMQEGLPIHAVDLSSATDRLPRKLSMGILRGLGYDQYADALEEFCQQPLDGTALGIPTMRFTVGQPMGLYGSFPLLQLTNLAVCHKSVKDAVDAGHELTTFFDGTHYKVLGDDVILSDSKIAQNYRKIMCDLGVDISEHKSFSGRVAEFAGFVSMRTNQGAATIRPYKIPSNNKLTNGIQFLDSLGVKVKKLSNWWEKIYNDYVHTVGKRDITLQPLVTNDDLPPSKMNRMDARTLMVRIQRILDTVPDPSLFPDIKGRLRENRVPLFQERGPYQFYGTDLDQLAVNHNGYYSYKNSFSTDPLMREQKKIRLEKEEATSIEDVYASLFADLPMEEETPPK